jgi:hypothetical protein
MTPPNGAMTPSPLKTSPQLGLATITMIDPLPCPVPGCHHSSTGSNRHFFSKSTLLRHLNHGNHQVTFHLANQSPISSEDSPPHQHASSALSMSLPNTISFTTRRHQFNHLPPPNKHRLYPTAPLTSEHPSSTLTARMEPITCGILVYPSYHRTPIITPPTSEPHDTATSNTTTAQFFSAYKPTPFKPSPTHMHSQSTPPPSGDFSSTLICLSLLPPLLPNNPINPSMAPSAIASTPSTLATLNTSTTWP